MTGDPLLDWAAQTLSVVNVMLLLWLGVTVLLGAERREWGLWLAGAGLLAGAAFFVSHSILLEQNLAWDRNLRIWGRVALSPVVLLPFGWYLLILWYAGYWTAPDSALHRRHRPWLWLIGLTFAVGMVAFALLAYPFALPPVLGWPRAMLISVTVMGAPIAAVGYIPYLLLCMLLSVDALRRPGPTRRVMGELARQRARPWLIATSVLLLGVATLVAWTILTLLPEIRRGAGLYVIEPSVAGALGRLDLAMTALSTLATLALGQALIAYEIFTGKSLPRGGLRQHWRNALLLAGGVAGLGVLSVRIGIDPLRALVALALLLAFLYGLQGWRSFADRERYIAHLRPFVASQHLYDHLLVPGAASPPEIDLRLPFQSLCRDVLGARAAMLVPVGPMAPLVRPPLAYPEWDQIAPPIGALARHFRSPHDGARPVDPAIYGGARWAVPLWSQRGLIGVLLLAEKRDGGLYTQEEIEIARESGERLLDTQASTALARRLMQLQRERLTESQLLDRRTRRVLHDEILPMLHTAMLALDRAGSNGTSDEALELLAGAHREISALLREMPPSIAPEVARRGLVGALRALFATELAGAFDGVSWEIDPAAERAADALPPLTAEVLFYAAREAIRNAARYGRPPGSDRPLHLRIALEAEPHLALVIEDDGIGFDPLALPDGAGQGISLHSTLLAVVGGTLVVESLPYTHTRVRLALPGNEGVVVAR